MNAAEFLEPTELRQQLEKPWAQPLTTDAAIMAFHDHYQFKRTAIAGEMCKGLTPDRVAWNIGKVLLEDDLKGDKFPSEYDLYGAYGPPLKPIDYLWMASLFSAAVLVCLCLYGAARYWL